MSSQVLKRGGVAALLFCGALLFATAVLADTDPTELPSDLEAEQKGIDKQSAPDIDDGPARELKPANRGTDSDAGTPNSDAVATNADHSGNSFGDDEDFLRSQDATGDTAEEDSPHRFHVALSAVQPLSSFNNLSGSNGTSVNMTNVGFDFEFTVDPHWSLGIVGSYISANATASVSGVSIATNVTGYFAAPTINYYSRRPYEGIWIQFGIGPEFLNVATVGFPSANVTLVPTFFSVGWRFLSDSRNLTFGIGLGPQFFLFQSPVNCIPVALTVDLLGVAWNIWPH